MWDLEQARRPLPGDAAIHSVLNDPGRLEVVRLSEDWRSDAREVWDTLTSLAARILQVPVSFVAVVQRDHDAYESQHGLPDALGSPPRLSGRTFCHLTLALNEMLVIGDTHQHERLKEVPTVGALGVRAYVGVPLRIDGQVIGSFCVVDTVPRTWDSAALAALAQLAASAERELLLRRAIEHGEMHARRASHLAQQREALVATVSHDLRTPLQVVQLTAQILKKRLGSAEQVLVDRLLQASASLRRLADVLTSERDLEESHSLRQPFSLRALVAASVAMMSGLAERADIALRGDHIDDVQVRIDDGEMLRVLANLIGNSLKYSPAGSAIRISTFRAGESVTLSVADNGPGMSESDAARAFDARWQGEAGKGRGEGDGLGLSIVANLVRRQGGAVTLRSAVGEGTCVEIALPVLPD